MIRARARLLGLLLLLLVAPAAGQRDVPPPLDPPSVRSPDSRLPGARDLVEVQVVVLAGGGRPDQIAFSYAVPVPDEQVREDFATLARELGQATVTPTIQRLAMTVGERPTVQAEANLTGLVNWQAGQLNLDALLVAFKRYRHLVVTFLFVTPLQVQWPRGSGARGPIQWQQTSAGPYSVTYHLWVDQSRGVPQAVPSLRPWGVGWEPLIGLGLIALTAGIGVFWIAHLILSQRRAAPSRERGP